MFLPIINDLFKHKINADALANLCLSWVYMSKGTFTLGAQVSTIKVLCFYMLYYIDLMTLEYCQLKIWGENIE